MSDLSPLKLVEDGQSSSGSQAIEESCERNDPQVVLPDRDMNRQNGDEVVITRPSVERPKTPSQTNTEKGNLKYGAKSVIDLFIPVSLCMGIVVATMKATQQYNYTAGSSIYYGQIMFTDQDEETFTKIWHAIANALMMLVMIVVMTSLLIFLYIYKFYKTIRGWLIMSSMMLLFIFTASYILVFLQVYNIPMDYITLSVSIWNIGIFGMICVHWKGPLLAQQSYLIVISALMALVFIKSLPDWTVWTVLATISIWDLVAVLPSQGPLRVLVETAQERNEPIFPALIYSSTIMWEIALSTPNSIIQMADLQHVTTDNERREPMRETQPSESQPQVEIIQPRRGSSDPRTCDDNKQSRNRRARNKNQASRRSSQPEQQPDVECERQDHTNADMQSVQNPNNQMQEEERGVKLGLGDFVFYSLLVGKVSSYDDWTITISCYISVLVGLSLTLSLLAIARKALPALPISIAFGLAFYFMSSLFMMEFASELSYQQIFI